MNTEIKNINTKNYDSVDLFKLIGSFLVVSIHTNIFSSISAEFNWYFVNMFSRLAVYFFFVSSSYFFFGRMKFENGKIAKCKDNANKLKKYFFRLSILYIIWSFIYMLSDIPMWYEQNCLTLKNFVGFGMSCVINTSHYHLWFLLSLVYAIPIIYFSLRFIKLKYIVVVSVFLYSIGLLYGEFSFIGLPLQNMWQHFGDVLPRFQTVFFYVIPICIFSIKCDSLNFSKVETVVLLITSFCLFSIEGIMVYIFFPDTVSSYSLFMIPTVIILFICVKFIPMTLKYNFLIRKLSTIIYCMHPLVMWALEYVYDFSTVNSMLYFLIVSAITAMFGYVIVKLSERIKLVRYFT